MRALALVAAGVLAQDFGELRARLGDGNADLRRRTVRELAQRGGTDAWELVLRALDDPQPRVADEAQLAFAELRDAASLELALGKEGLAARDELVRRRVVEGLGRAPIEVPAEPLADALEDRDARVRRLGAWSVERRAAGGLAVADPGEELLPSVLGVVARDREPGVRAAAVLALAALDAGAALERADALLAESTPLRCAGLRVLAAHAPPERALPALRAALADADWIVRRQSVELLAELAGRGERAAARGLVDALAGEGEERLVQRLVDLLRGLSGLRHGRDPEPWTVWADGLADGWRPPVRPPGGGRGERDLAREADGAAGTVAAFAGLPVRSSRVAFLIDLSGSMRFEVESGRERIEVVAAELERALGSLPESARFLLVPFADEPLPWRDELVPADRGNVSRAAKAFAKERRSGKGNVWDAVLLALADPEVDTIVVLSDGAPSGGPHWNFDLMLELLLERNRFRHATFDAVLVDPSGVARTFWRRLAEATGGMCVDAEWR